VATEIDYLDLADAELLRQCEVDTYRASGPGGQKRNKTSSAVRLRHRPTALMVVATESRSQHENRARALRRLRERIALEVRRPVTLASYAPSAPVLALFQPGGRPSPKTVAYWRGVRGLLDLFVTVDCAVRATAARLEVSSAAVSRALIGERALWRKVNELRGERGLAPLR
jgi:hypothetical protein